MLLNGTRYQQQQTEQNRIVKMQRETGNDKSLGGV